MITRSIIVLIQALISVICFLNKRAIKLRVALFLLSTFLFYELSHTTRGVLIPIILYLMFMGGILITFMIISAITPSAKISKTKKTAGLRLSVIAAVALLIERPPLFNYKISQEFFLYKTILVQLPLMLLIVLVLLVYFFSIISIISRRNRNLRTLIWCYKKFIL